MATQIEAPATDMLQRFIREALHEDIGTGDHTSAATVPASATDKAHLLIKDEGVLAGVSLARMIFQEVDESITFDQRLSDGTAVKHGDVAFYVEGPSRSLLQAERLALNCMQRMSGIATMTRRFTEQIDDLHTQILDTRKTTPLLRFLEKWAVRIGGGTNYRDGLYDRIMIKDNHVEASGGIQDAIIKVEKYLRQHDLQLEMTVEVRDLDELRAAIAVGEGRIQRLMLDNFSPDQIREALDIIDGRFESEASGGITLETVRAYAETGVDFISVGALTHSYHSLDMSLKIIE